MSARVIFLGVTVFWVTMNVLLWRAEFGARGGDTPVPIQLVWRKILTAPDTSSLSVYEKGSRMGYCEVSTGVGQQMAAFEEGKPPPGGFADRPGFLLRVAGNVSLGDFTNRLKFDGRLQLDRLHQWEELYLKITCRLTVIEVRSAASNQTARVSMSNNGVPLLNREVAFTDLQNPGALLQALMGAGAADFGGALDLAGMLPDPAALRIQWDARRTRVKIGSEAVPVYQLETSLLGHALTVDVSTLGEILCIELPGDISARIDEWGKP